MAVQASQLWGAWELTRFSIVTPDGETRFPYGEDAAGRLFYLQDGTMSACLARNDRGSQDAGFESAAKLSEEERLLAFDGYTHYTGTYELHGNQVRHHIELSLLPSMIGKRVAREAKIEDDELVLGYTTKGGRGDYRYQLRWKKRA